MQEEVSGGKPPLGQDFNGILNALSTHVFAQQAGQLYRYSSAVSTAIGGYPVGTMLESTDGVTVWFNVVAANTADPDANGAGWVPMFNYGYTTKSGLTGGIVTLTLLEARRGVIVLTGTLASNLAVVLPTTLASWLIVNNTTGAFTTTVRTAAGTGVTVPQGGFAAPTGVYGNGTSIFYTVAPLGIPIDQAPSALSIAQRTNAGYLLATYFNQNSGLENVTIGAVFFQNVAADGFLRKISLANFLAQILSNAALTGVPTAPTAAINDNTFQVANTGFVFRQTFGTSSRDVIGSRSIGSAYTNTTGRPIFVTIGGILNGVSMISDVDFYVDSVLVASISAGVSQNSGQSVSFIVPPGSTYATVLVAGAFNVNVWTET
jgi:hypothetical protein